MQQSSFSGASRCCSRCLCVAASSNEPFGINFCPYAMPAYTPGTVSLRLSKYVATAAGTATAAKEESKQEARQRQQISDITWALNTIRMRIKLGGHRISIKCTNFAILWNSNNIARALSYLSDLCPPQTFHQQQQQVGIKCSLCKHGRTFSGLNAH